jgi:hypothetical protein
MLNALQKLTNYHLTSRTQRNGKTERLKDVSTKLYQSYPSQCATYNNNTRRGYFDQLDLYYGLVVDFLFEFVEKIADVVQSSFFERVISLLWFLKISRLIHEEFWEKSKYIVDVIFCFLFHFSGFLGIRARSQKQ